jgi:Protein kinase domain/PEGA domain
MECQCYNLISFAAKTMAEPQQIGRYVILEELGRGGTGCVVRAEDPAIHRQVALKLIPLAGHEGFLDAIRAAPALQHPGIVPVLDAGRQDDTVYVVRELVEGVSLEAMLRQTPGPQLATVLAICRQAAAALDYAHTNGVIHGNVKPTNILIDKTGAARLVDFAVGSSDAGTDQLSLATIVPTALAGAKPRPAALDTVMAKATNQDPALRYASCAEFMDAVNAALPAPAAKPGTTLVAAALGVILAMIAVAFFVLKQQERPAPASVSSTVAASTAAYSKPAPGVTAARKAQMSAPSEPVPQTAPAAEPPKSGAAGQTLQVQLTTNPPGAAVIIDGRRESACKSPCTADLSEGVHTLIAKKEGYRSMLQNFQVAGEGEEVAVTLNPITGSLVLETEPAGAAIAVNGAPRAEVTPVTLALPVGKYRVRLTHAGNSPYEFDAVILPESTREVAVRLAK